MKHLITRKCRLIIARRNFLGLLAGATVSPLVARAQLLLLGAGSGATGSGPPPSGSAWGDHGTNSTLSTTTIANDTVTGTGSSSDLSMARGTLAHSSGKYYFEVKVLSAPAASIFAIGVMDNTTANGAPMDGDPNTMPNDAFNKGFNGDGDGAGTWNSTNIGAAITVANGDVLGYALDMDNQFGYLALNNTYFLSGNPASGGSGTGKVASSVSGNARPAIGVFSGGGIGGIFQLITTSAAFTYPSLPSGYSEWG